MGNELLTLINERQFPGNYSVNFDGNNFPSGIYFYRLEADGLIRNSRRMVLLK
ncbi:MAG: hypothetical protein IPM38_09860 [Ignavibacteria bacterium]|nr:hypothetical protein [Ignavibacteria bacterium]